MRCRMHKRRKGAASAAGTDIDSAAPAAAASSEPRAPKASKRQSTIPDANHTLLYVNNLSFDSTTEDVSKLFSDRLGAAPMEVDCELIRRFHRGQLHWSPLRRVLAMTQSHRLLHRGAHQGVKLEGFFRLRARRDQSSQQPGQRKNSSQLRMHFGGPVTRM